jgi:putative Mg2+ transporter-C (MgtC) family protein
MNDLMRLPLGILSGMGFIGAGAIIRRDHFVAGVTTAATMWFLTVIGLCYGGGQIALGLVAGALALVVLTPFKVLEDRMKQDRQGKLLIVIGASGPGENEIRSVLWNDGLWISSCAFASGKSEDRELIWDLQWRARPNETQAPESVYRLMAQAGVIRVAWRPQER